MRRILLFLMGSLLSGVALAECFPDKSSYQIAGSIENFQIYYQASPEEMPVGETLELDVIVCQDDRVWSGDLGVDATMPAHGHGMNYNPEVTQVEPGRFHVKGVLFHMPGEWQLDFTLRGQNPPHSVKTTVKIR